MSPIGRIFIVLNLILSAAFAGWAANNLSTSENFKEQLATAQAATAALEAEKNGEISDQATKISGLESQAGSLRNDNNSLQAEKTRLEVELANTRQQSSALQSDLTGIKESLNNYADNNRNIQDRLDQAIANEKAADAQRREAEDAREEALAAQRGAEEASTSASNSIASLERDREDLRRQVSDLDAQLKTVVNATGFTLTGSMPAIDGAVLQVVNDMTPGLVSINRGSDDGVTRGYTFEIYSGGQYKGQVRVESVQKNICTAVVVRTWNDASISAGDSASTHI